MITQAELPPLNPAEEQPASSGKRRVQTPAEELWNTATHGLGLVIFLTAGPWLLAERAYHGTPGSFWGALAFVLSALLLYLSSTLYHLVPPGKAKEKFDQIDHAAIYLLIAGTYTPFTLGPLRGPWGWSLFALVWTMAIAGVYLKLWRGIGNRRLSTALYLGMGWSALLAIKPLYEALPREGFWWLVAGGVAYTVGVLFYSARKLPFSHAIWHLFVVAGSACHFWAIFRYT